MEPLYKGSIEQIEMVQRRAARWVTNRYSSYNSVSAMLGNLGWRSLEYRRCDSRLAMFYKIQYGLVAVPMPSYFEHPKKITRHSLDNLLSYRYILLLIFTGVHPLQIIVTVVLWNSIPAETALFSDLDSFKREVSKINYSKPK